jgi:hypothetical protein
MRCGCRSQRAAPSFGGRRRVSLHGPRCLASRLVPSTRLSALGTPGQAWPPLDRCGRVLPTWEARAPVASDAGRSVWRESCCPRCPRAARMGTGHGCSYFVPFRRDTAHSSGQRWTDTRAASRWEARAPIASAAGRSVWRDSCLPRCPNTARLDIGQDQAISGGSRRIPTNADNLRVSRWSTHGHQTSAAHWSA